jgi:hypothetical protein
VGVGRRSASRGKRDQEVRRSLGARQAQRVGRAGLGSGWDFAEVRRFHRLARGPAEASARLTERNRLHESSSSIRAALVIYARGRSLRRSGALGTLPGSARFPGITGVCTGRAFAASPAHVTRIGRPNPHGYRVRIGDLSLRSPRVERTSGCCEQQSSDRRNEREDESRRSTSPSGGRWPHGHSFGAA